MISSAMENRHMPATSRPFANSKARRAEKDVPDWKLASKRNNGKKAASNNNNITVRNTRDIPPRQQQLLQSRQAAKSSPHTIPSRRGGRLRSPSLPAISEAIHYSHCRSNDGPNTAYPSITTVPRSATTSSTGTASELAAVQGLRDSNEALLALVTELIRQIPASIPVHEMIQKREEVRVLADNAYAAAVAEVNRHRYNSVTATAPPLPLLDEDAEKKARKPNGAKGYHPRSKSSVF
ncbi:hypothetical protein PG984_016280 [Apiospora sp. TS-2023a]